MIALGIIVLFLLVLSFLKIGISAIWDNELSLTLVLGPVRINLISPDKKKAKKTENKKEKSGKASGEKKDKKFNARVLLSKWRELLSLLGKILRMPVLDPLIVRVTFGGDDPADSAINYGRAWSIVGVLVPILETHFRIGHREIDVQHDFDCSETNVYVKTFLYARVWQCVAFAFSALVLLIRLYREMNDTKKAV